MDKTPDEEFHGEHVFSIQRIKKDLAKAAATMSPTEARFFVDQYYISQEDRKRAHNQERSMDKEPHDCITWLAEQSGGLEGQCKRILDKYTDAHPSGQWMKSVHGIGPVIAAGLLAHIDIARAPTVGHIYSYAGIAGSGQKPWLKGEKRPYNASLKTLCWKIGQSFLKFSNDEACEYGKIYKERKIYEVERDQRGDNAEKAAQILIDKNFGKTTEAYKHLSSGHLPPAQLNQRACRFATKIFLSHVHCVMYWLECNALPPNPYALNILGHAHFIRMPNIDSVPGLGEALRTARLI